MNDFEFDEFWYRYNKIKAASSTQKDTARNKICFGRYLSKNSLARRNNRSAKQAVVKMISNLGKKGVKNCIAYVLRNSENNLATNENGEPVSEEKIYNEWSKNFSDKESAKEAWHLVFSVKEDNGFGTTRLLKSCVKEIMQNNFYGHKYALAIHTHQNNPHVHVILNKRNELTKRKIHFNGKEEIKDFFNDLRDNFAYALNARGLNYDNFNSLETDLRTKLQKLQNKSNINEENAKERISDAYMNLKNKFIERVRVKESRIKTAQDELEGLRKNYFELINLANQYKKKKNKKFYKIAKEIKQITPVLREKENQVKSEFKDLQNAAYKANLIAQKQTEHYYDKNRALTMQKEFIATYEKLFPKHKGVSKSEYNQFLVIKNAIRGNEVALNQEAKTLIDTSLNLIQISLKNQNLFSLAKKYSILESNTYILKNSNLNYEDYKNYLERLENNKNLIKDLSEKRFDFIEKKILSSKQIDKTKFEYKEYQKGIEYLQKESKIKLNAMGAPIKQTLKEINSEQKI